MSEVSSLKKMKKCSICQSRGFTLIEVMVAVAVIAVMPALLLAIGKQADNAGALRNKAIAAWVADNTLTRLRLERELNESTLRSTEEETVEMAGAEWVVIMEPEQTELGALLRYRIKVGLDREKILYTLDGYVN